VRVKIVGPGTERGLQISYGRIGVARGQIRARDSIIHGGILGANAQSHRVLFFGAG
jgi:hypothetical protein